jgi:hypothetical protein
VHTQSGVQAQWAPIAGELTHMRSPAYMDGTTPYVLPQRQPVNRLKKLHTVATRTAMHATAIIATAHSRLLHTVGYSTQ